MLRCRSDIIPKQEGGHKNYRMPSSNGRQNPPPQHNPTRRPISIHYNCLLSAFFVASLLFISISVSAAAAAIVVVFVGIIVVGFGSRLF